VLKTKSKQTRFLLPTPCVERFAVSVLRLRGCEPDPALRGRLSARKGSKYFLCGRSQVKLDFVGFEVFTAVVVKSFIFWDMTPCSPLIFNRRFGRTYHLHLQGRRISQAALPATCFTLVSSLNCSLILKMEAIYSSETSLDFQWTSSVSYLLHAGFLLDLLIDPEDGGDMFHLKYRLTFNGLHGVISQKTELCMTIAVRTSHPTHSFRRSE
jgi:hypothetical protein